MKRKKLLTGERYPIVNANCHATEHRQSSKPLPRMIIFVQY